MPAPVSLPRPPKRITNAPDTSALNSPSAVDVRQSASTATLSAPSAGGLSLVARSLVSLDSEETSGLRALRQGRRKSAAQLRGSRLISEYRADGGGDSRVVRAESVHVFNRDRHADSVRGHCV